MKFFSINKNWTILITALSLFCMMPMLWSKHLLDNDATFRFIALSGIVLFVSGFFLVGLTAEMAEKIHFLFRSRVFLFFTGYVMIVSISWFFSINKGEALYEWIKTSLLFLLFIYISLFIFRNTENRNTFIFFISIAAIIFSTIGLLQIIPLVTGYFESGKAIHINYAINSSLSNKNFFAETLLLCLPFALCGIKFFSGARKIISIVSTLLILFFIVILQTLSVWIAFAAATFFIMGLFIFYRKQLQSAFNLSNNLKTSRILLLVIISGALAASFFVYQKSGGVQSIKKRIQTAMAYITDSPIMEENTMVNNNSTYERMILWRNSWKMIKEHPFGTGLNNWKIYFPKYGISGAPYMNSGNVRFEYPHNDFLYIWCEKGILGIAFYLLMFASAFYTILKNISSSQKMEKRWLSVAMLFGLAVFMVISFFGFPNERIFSSIMLMIIFALIINLFEKKDNPQVVESKKTSSNRYRLIFISGMIVSGAGLYIGTERLKSEKHLVNAVGFQNQKNWNRMIREAQKAENFFFPMDYASTPIEWYNGFANFYAGNQLEALRRFKEAEKINPYHVHILSDLGTSYQLEGDLQKTYEYYERGLSISPYYPVLLVNMAVLKYNEGKIDSSFIIISKFCTKPDQDYLRVLKVVLKTKAERIISVVQDSVLRNTLQTKINNEKWLRDVYEQSDKKLDKFEENILKKL